MSLQGMVGLTVPLVPDIREWVLVVKEMRSEGIAWLQPDLMQSDVSALLPVLIGTTNLVNVEVGSFLSAPASQTRRPFRAQAVLIWLYRGMSVAVIPIAMQVPSVSIFLEFLKLTKSRIGSGYLLAILSSLLASAKYHPKLCEADRQE